MEGSRIESSKDHVTELSRNIQDLDRLKQKAEKEKDEDGVKKYGFHLKKAVERMRKNLTGTPSEMSIK